MTDRLSGKSIVVTGAGRGIGAGIARGLAAEGALVTVVDRDKPSAVATAQSIESAGGRAQVAVADVTDRASVRKAITAAVDTYGRLDVMFNNAGLNVPRPFLDITEDAWHTVMNVNALGVLIGTQEAAKQMIAQGGPGKIVNTASIAGREGYASFAPYSASKFAVVALTQAAARSLADKSITVNGFSPGVVDTPLWEQLDKDLVAIGDAEKPGDAFAAFASGALIGRAATPEDIVPTAIFLAAPDSDYITGQIMAVDGGMVLV
jgi:meso-butanediol dehydrogenase / (S,S)-butanediol dehydrogenase / diacetyl reductase